MRRGEETDGWHTKKSYKVHNVEWALKDGN